MTPRMRLWKRLAIGTIVSLAAAWGILVLLTVWWGQRDQARPAAAIVVLGAAQYVGRPSPVLRARIDHAIKLWRAGYAPLLIFTGGTGAGDTTSEAAVSRRYAIRRGVPADAIVLENEGRTTSESLNAVVDIMAAHPSRKVILVSDPFHMLRLSILARRLGLEPYTSPTRTSPISMNRSEAWKYILSESVKIPLAYILERKPQ